jgi:hypothetical protein
MADIILRPCPECGATTPGYGPSQWCFRCEKNDIARVLRRDGGVSESDAIRLADLLMERDPKPITSRGRYEAIR